MRARLDMCVKTKGNILSCLFQKEQTIKVAPSVDTASSCCAFPQDTTDRSHLSSEERVLIQQLQERNCLFRDDIKESLRTTADLDTYITTQDVEHVLFHMFGGNVAPQEDVEHRRYRLQAKEILPA